MYQFAFSKNVGAGLSRDKSGHKAPPTGKLIHHRISLAFGHLGFGNLPAGLLSFEPLAFGICAASGRALLQRGNQLAANR
jgi:hypothetical protein